MSAREDILKAAENLFGEVGFDATTTREITRLSGVNKALMYYYFDSKDALLDSILDSYFSDLNRIQLKALEEGGDLRERLERVMTAYVDFLKRNVNFSLIVQRAACGGKHVEIILKHMLPMFQLGIEMIQETYPQTQSGEMSAAQLLISFYGMIITYFTYGPLLGRLMDVDPFSKKNIAVRKKHLQGILDIVMEKLDEKSRQRK